MPLAFLKFILDNQEIRYFQNRENFVGEKNEKKLPPRIMRGFQPPSKASGKSGKYKGHSENSGEKEKRSRKIKKAHRYDDENIHNIQKKI